MNLKGKNIHSKKMTEGISRMPNRAMLRAIGMKDDDFSKPFIGIASAGSDVSPCNLHLDDIADISKKQLKENGVYPTTFHTFVVTDGQAMGHEGDEGIASISRYYCRCNRTCGNRTPNGCSTRYWWM